MYSQDDSNILWVCQEDDSSGNGSFARPFGRIQNALEKALPGQTILLKEGTYVGDVTIDANGTIDKPLRIAADKGAKVIISEACWYLYDVSDAIISGLTFSHSPLGSIAILGLCERNRFEFLSFDNCGTSQKASSTMFFGGSGATCNIVEHCVFNRANALSSVNKNPDDIIVGLMISEGDVREGKAIKNHIIRKNTFTNYDYGILVGADDTTMKPYGHIIAYNVIDNCTSEGVMVKCGDTHIKGNIVTNCKKNSISIVTGESSIIEDNRIADCENGLHVAGIGHSILNNCIVRCKSESIRVFAQCASHVTATENIFIEHNSLIGHKNVQALLIEPKASVLVQKNLFFALEQPLETVTDTSIVSKLTKTETIHIQDNLLVGNCLAPLPGIICDFLEFADAVHDNFDTTSEYGAHGWMTNLHNGTPDLEKDEQQTACLDSDDDRVEESAFTASYTNDDYENELLEKTFFFDTTQEDIADDPENDETLNEPYYDEDEDDTLDKK